MAARTNRITQTQRTKDKIQASQIENALNNHVLGKNKMSSTQVRAAEILLKKRKPDLQAVQYQDSEGNTMAPAFIMTINAPKG